MLQKCVNAYSLASRYLAYNYSRSLKPHIHRVHEPEVVSHFVSYDLGGVTRFYSVLLVRECSAFLKLDGESSLRYSTL